MGTLFVVFLQSSRREPAGLGQVLELLDVQQLVAKSAEERFGEAVLPRRTRLDVEQLQAGSLTVTANGTGDQLGAIVAADVLGNTSREEQVRQHVDDPVRRDAAIDFQGQTFPRVLVGDRKPLQRSASGWCLAGETSFAVDGDGVMRRCHFVGEPIGNINDPNWEMALRSRRCPNLFCECFLGKAQLERESVQSFFGDYAVLRQPSTPAIADE